MEHLSRNGETPQDTYRVDWSPPATWRHVWLTDFTRVRLHVEDEDGVRRDEIGTVDIGAEQLQAALQMRRVLQVNVADQSNRQLLFVGVAVIAEAPATFQARR
jgi:hypothetical protein